MVQPCVLLGAFITQASWAGPRPDLYRPFVAAPPSADEALALVEELSVQVQAGPVDPAWLQDIVRPQALPGVPAPEWYAAMAAMLGGSGHQTFSNPQSIAVSEGPDYQRVVLQGQPLISVVIRRDGEDLRIDRIEHTSCDLCDEPTRFVRDLLVDVQRRGPAARRLLPTIELFMGELEDADPDTASRWPAAWLARANQGGDLSWWLSQAVVSGSTDNVVALDYSDGTQDSWTVRYYRGRWVVDYDALPPTSPLRLTDAQAKSWRDRRQLATSALDRWRPKFEPLLDGRAQEIGDRAIDADFDAFDGSVWIAVLDLDRILSGLFRVDPHENRVMERRPIPPPDPRSNSALGQWYSQWHAQLRPDAQAMAISLPGRVRTLSLKAGTRGGFRTHRPITSLSWGTSSAGEPTVLAGMGGRVQVVGPEVWDRYRMTGYAVAVGQIGTQLWAVSHHGSLIQWQIDVPDAPVATQEVCCGAAIDAAASPDGSELLVTCASVCDQAAVRVDLLGGQPTIMSATGSDHKGASWSSDGRWFTTPAQGEATGALVWRSRDDQPVALLPTTSVQRIRWSPDNTQILTVGADGRVLLWDLAAVLDAGLDP